MYECHHEPLLPRQKFYARLRRHGLFACLTLTGCVGLGMAGYHWLEGMGWVDSYANATMILSGMGPLDPIKTAGGRLFAGTYALFSGVAFLTTVAFSSCRPCTACCTSSTSSPARTSATSKLPDLIAKARRSGNAGSGA